MRTAFPIENLIRPSRAGRALTILEMLVSTAMLSVIVLGLTAMFVQTQKAFKMGIKQSDSTDAGRAIIDMIASDLNQMTDAHFTNVINPWVAAPPSAYYAQPPTNLYWQWVPGNDLVQTNTGPNGLSYWTNQLEDLFVLIQTNNTWTGVGYVVSNWFTNSGGGAFPGVGTLYRCYLSTNGPLAQNNLLYTNFTSFQYGMQSGFFTNCHPVANGVVDLKITTFDSHGNQNTNELGYQGGVLQYPVVVQNPTNNLLYTTNYLPHSVDIELGILEPEAFEHARALFTAGATAAASNYLASCAGQVQIFRQHIIVPAAP